MKAITSGNMLKVIASFNAIKLLPSIFYKNNDKSYSSTPLIPDALIVLSHTLPLSKKEKISADLHIRTSKFLSIDYLIIVLAYFFRNIIGNKDKIFKLNDNKNERDRLSHFYRGGLKKRITRIL